MTKAMVVLKTTLLLTLLAAAAWIVISATSYNTSRGDLCEEQGLAFGSEYMGEYGCVELHPFEEFEQPSSGSTDTDGAS
ncbi:MAG: hypothetical protein K0Q52_108 [Microbacterium sp.]|jgi:hypothetical protein|nr:hypothetical protein [Microbacterium sp.]